ERLRKVIGKKVDEGELISLVEKAFRSGWTLIKLYFMVGLPTETDEDVDEIARVISRVASVGRSVPGRHNVNVTLSPFVPKPGTPFQWEAQEPPETVAGKLSRIRGKVRARSVKLKVHDPWASLVEGLLARGDCAMAGVLETAWRLGARLDGWGERFDFSLWEKAFETHRLDWRSLLEKRAEDRQLPWHFVGTPVSEPFLAGQRDLAREGLVMPDCKDGSCLDCGAEKAPVCRKLRTPSDRAPEIEAGPLSTGTLPVATQELDRKLWRLQYARHGLLRFYGHLDMVRNIEFLLRRSGVPVCYSAGYSPRMRLHFSAPLPLGLESRAEYFEVETLPDISEPELRQALEQASSGLEGFAFLAVRPVPIGLLPPLAQDLCLCSYSALVELPGPAAGADPAEYLGQCRQRRLEEDATVAWTDPRGRSRTAEVGEALGSVAAGEPAGDRVSLTFELALQGPGACRPDRFLSWLLELENGKVASARIEKVRAYVRRGDFLKDPMEF
ncbi:MAG: DUF2344 domain-containing protein, partial [Candidatus Glassbacteria bacterium]|nr:DUF2344 domain-containing protein [Candidatus Glassbacteria bacterium]